MQLDADRFTAAANDTEANWCDATLSYDGDLGTPGTGVHSCDGVGSE
jgi:hypothetical protein